MAEDSVSRLEELPPEQRNEIWYEALLEETPIDLLNLTEPGLLRTSRLQGSETCTMYFAINQFKLTIDNAESQREACEFLLQKSKQLPFQAIQKLHIEVLATAPASGWRWFVACLAVANFSERHRVTFTVMPRHSADDTVDAFHKFLAGNRENLMRSMLCASTEILEQVRAEESWRLHLPVYYPYYYTSDRDVLVHCVREVLRDGLPSDYLEVKSDR